MFGRYLKIFLPTLTVTSLLVFSVFNIFAATDNVTICHRTNSATNPYTSITINPSALDGVAGNSESEPDHYGEHQGPLASSEAVAQDLKDAKIEWGDIIPPVSPFHTGLNWTTEGQAIWN